MEASLNNQESNNTFHKTAKEVEERVLSKRHCTKHGCADDIRKNSDLDCQKYCQKLSKEVRIRAVEGIIYGFFGRAYQELGDLKSATSCYEQQLKIAKEVGNRTGEEIAYCNLGIAYEILGYFKRAIDCHELQVKIAKEIFDRASEGRAYGNLGNSYHKLGDFKRSIHYHELCLKIAKEIKDKDAEGTAYNNLGNAYRSLGYLKKAKDYYMLSLEMASEVQDRAGIGSAYGNLGIIYRIFGDVKKAIDYHECHIKIAKETGDRAGEAMAYGNLGIAYRVQGDFIKAINYHKLHLKTAKEVNDRVSEGSAYCNLGNDHQRVGNFKTALTYHELYLEVAKEVGSRAEEGSAYCYIGNAHVGLGNTKTAIYYYECHLKIAKELGQRDAEGIAYGNLGGAHLELGHFKRATNYSELCLQISKEVGDKSEETRAYSNLGSAYLALGDFKKSMIYHKLSLNIAKEVGFKKAEGAACGNIGTAFLNLGNIEEAIHYYRLHVKIAKEVKDRVGEGSAYGNLGYTYYLLGDLEQAIEYHERHLKIAKEVGDKCGEGSACGNLGTAHCILKDFEKAKDFNEVYLKIAKETGNKAEEAKAYYFLGFTFQSMGSLFEAVNCCESSVKILNEITFRAQFKDEWKIDLRDLFQNAYTSLWRLFLKQGKILYALLAAEQGRAQALTHLMEMNYEFDTSFIRSDTPDEGINDILSVCLPSTVFTAIGVQEIFFWVSREGDAEMRRKEISDKRWQDDVSNFFRSLIQDAFKEIGVRGGVKCEDRSLNNLRDENLANESAVHTKASSSLNLQQTSLRTLYDFIIEPIADLVHGNEIILVPEGPLCLLPHSAFMDSESRYLSESYRIRVIPSLTSLKLLADCPADYHCKTGALLVGDPWVQECIYKGRKLHQLPCARQEVEMIGQILNTAPLTGTEATKDTVLQRLSSVALVHIAAHGRMETGEIALAPNPKRASEIPTEKDFLLTMADVLSVQIRARLVVLSCCHSGRGEIKAEGVVGIARAFMGAGARSVLVSLWAINDEATLEFMKSFYQHLAEGKSASEALNQAMKCMRESDKFSEVKHWAPFVLIGDDVTLEFGANG